MRTPDMLATLTAGLDIDQDSEIQPDTIRGECSVCGWALNEKPSEGAPGGVSHTYCAPCAGDAIREMRKVAAEIGRGKEAA